MMCSALTLLCAFPSRRLLRAWPGGCGNGAAAGRGVCFSEPLAADLGLCSEAVAEGRAAGLGVCFSALLIVEVGSVGLGVCFSAPLAAELVPNLEVVAHWWRGALQERSVAAGHGREETRDQPALIVGVFGCQVASS